MSAIEKRFKLPPRFPKSKNLWLEYANLASQYKPLDLGMGFPDSPPPTFLTDALLQVARSDNCLLHQYTRYYGHPRIVHALGRLYSSLLGRQLDQQNEILITVGAFEGIFSSIMGHVDHGDEVIIIEPFFDCYVPMVKIAGGVPRFATLERENGSWILNQEKLESLFNARTKLIILNNPHNCFGKVFKMEELEHLARLCVKNNVVCLSDEVYEWTVFKPNKHIRIVVATLPGMWDRTITIGSVGKTFAATGWKVGWAYGLENLLHNLKTVHGNSVKTAMTPIQEAVAIALEQELSRLNQEDCYLTTFPKELKSKRDFMVKIFTEIGVKPVVAEGGYFITVDWSPIVSQLNLTSEDDITKWLIRNGIQGSPLTAFYSDEHCGLGENLVRFCYVKKHETLQKAADLLRKLQVYSTS